MIANDAAMAALLAAALRIDADDPDCVKWEGTGQNMKAAADLLGALVAANARLTTLLRDIEWAGYINETDTMGRRSKACPSCGAGDEVHLPGEGEDRPAEHHRGCELARALGVPTHGRPVVVRDKGAPA